MTLVAGALLVVVLVQTFQGTAIDEQRLESGSGAGHKDRRIRQVGSFMEEGLTDLIGRLIIQVFRGQGCLIDDGKMRMASANKMVLSQLQGADFLLFSPIRLAWMIAHLCLSCKR